MADKTNGHRNGDQCPECKGLITVRETLPPGQIDQYAQCANCSFNTLR